MSSATRGCSDAIVILLVPRNRVSPAVIYSKQPICPRRSNQRGPAASREPRPASRYHLRHVRCETPRICLHKLRPVAEADPSIHPSDTISYGHRCGPLRTSGPVRRPATRPQRPSRRMLRAFG
ncbi:hypothetical protein OH77DRAFT_231057 [Trametes cingulata]|nr:hypothetical protein OH77DRAFT_231057 [Trametes cingulata]